MLETRNLSNLLTENVHAELFPSIFAMSHQGTLVAYSTPADIKQLRDQAALASMALKDLEEHPESKVDSLVHVLRDGDSVQSFAIVALSHNLVLQRIQPDLYLVLLGAADDQVTKPPDAPTSCDDEPEYIHDADLFRADDNATFSKLMLKTHLQKTNTIASYMRRELSAA